jgi:hypothetical protein
VHVWSHANLVKKFQQEVVKSSAEAGQMGSGCVRYLCKQKIAGCRLYNEPRSVQEEANTSFLHTPSSRHSFTFPLSRVTHNEKQTLHCFSTFQQRRRQNQLLTHTHAAGTALLSHFQKQQQQQEAETSLLCPPSRANDDNLSTFIYIFQGHD